MLVIAVATVATIHVTGFEASRLTPPREGATVPRVAVGAPATRRTLDWRRRAEFAMKHPDFFDVVTLSC